MTDSEEQLQREVIEISNAQLLPETSFTLFKEKLALYINDLVNHNFEKLISILYRLDVSEKIKRNTCIFFFNRCRNIDYRNYY